MGKVMNKFLDFLNLNGYDDDDFEDYDDDFEEEAPKAVVKKTAAAKDTYLDDYEEDDEPENKKVSRFKPVKSKVVPMGGKGMEVCVIRPSTVEEDGSEISDTLLSGRAVILNLEGLQVKIAQRIIDFTAGACYSIKGNFRQVSNYIFIITPESVDISGDFLDLLSGTGSFDVSAFRSGPEV